MKLALRIEEVGNFRRILGFILTVRKQCIFKFNQDELSIISVDRDSPIIWGSISKINFTRYDVIAKENNIGLELNAEPLFQVLKNYEKSPSTSDLSIKLQRGEETNTNSINKRRPVFLALTYNEDVTITTEISHSFSIPVNLIRNQMLERIQMPEIHNVELIVDLDQKLKLFFNRVERYKAADSINIVMNRLGEIKIEFDDERKKISLKWKGLLETYKPEDVDTQAANKTEEENYQDLNMIKEITVKVKLKWWIIASKLTDFCETLHMYIYEDGCVFNCHIEDEQSCSILYYVNGKILD
jgi:G2-specific checkpoint protein